MMINGDRGMQRLTLAPKKQLTEPRMEIGSHDSPSFVDVLPTHVRESDHNLVVVLSKTVSCVCPQPCPYGNDNCAVGHIKSSCCFYDNPAVNLITNSLLGYRQSYRRSDHKVPTGLSTIAPSV